MNTQEGARTYVVTYRCDGCSGGLDILGVVGMGDKKPGDIVICSCGSSCVIEETSTL